MFLLNSNRADINLMSLIGHIYYQVCTQALALNIQHSISFHPDVENSKHAAESM